MSRSVTFNGITKFRPGGITKVNAENLNQVGVSASSVVALIGEADGGAPGSVSGVVSMRDPSRAAELFRSGPVVDAARLAFQSSGDPRIPGGASEVLVYKVNAGTQSSVHVPDPTKSLHSDTVDSGASTTSVPLVTGGLTEDDLIGRWVDVAINSLPTLASVTATGGTTRTAEAAGLTADQYVGYIVQFGSSTSTAALQDEYATIISNDGDAFTFGEELPAAVSSGDTFDILATFRRKVSDNTASALTLEAALPAAPASGDGVFVRPTLYELTSLDYGTHTSGITHDLEYDAVSGTYTATVSLDGEDQTSEPLGGQNFLEVYYRGGANAVSTDTVDPSTPATATSVTLTTGGLSVGAHDGATVVITNPATNNSEQVKIDKNAAGAIDLVAPGLSPEFVAEINAASAGTVLVDVKTVTDAVAGFLGENGSADSFVSEITGVAGDDLVVPVTSTTTVQQLVDAINANPNYLARVAPGTNGDTVLASTFDFYEGTALPSAGDSRVNIQRDFARNDGAGFRRDLQLVIDWLNDSAELVTASRVDSADPDGAALPKSESFVDATFEDPFQLAGGTRGVSTNSDWQAAFDALLLVDADSVSPLIDQNLVEEGLGSSATWASVAAQLADHVTQARGAAGSERGGYIGFRGDKDAVAAAANSINDPDVALCAQSPTVLDASGTLVTKGPRMQAVMAASMRSGVPEVGEPLTYKFLRVSGITQDSSWDPSDATDAADLIRAGVLFAESVPGQGVRWVRDLTTWVKNDNLAYSEGSVRSVVRYVARNLRREIEDRFTGRKASPSTIGNIRDAAASILEVYRGENIIVDSTDPATGSQLRAWHNLRVTSSGDVVNINVGICPAVGINFQLNEIFLQLPTQAA